MGKKEKHTSAFAQAISHNLHKQLIEGDNDDDESADDENSVVSEESYNSPRRNTTIHGEVGAKGPRFVFLDMDDRGYWAVRNPNRKSILTRESMVAAAAEINQLVASLPPGADKIKLSLDIGGATSGTERSSNAIGPEGISVILDALTTHASHISIRRLKLHGCQLGNLGTQRLAEYIRTVRKIPPEIHLSHNNISTESAIELVQAIGTLKEQLPFRATDGKYPLWLRLEMNRIDPEAFKKACLAVGLHICPSFRLKAQNCDSRHCIQRPVPQLHYPFISSQRVGVQRLVQQFSASKLEKSLSPSQAVPVQASAPISPAHHHDGQHVVIGGAVKIGFQPAEVKSTHLTPADVHPAPVPAGHRASITLEAPTPVPSEHTSQESSASQLPPGLPNPSEAATPQPCVEPPPSLASEPISKSLSRTAPISTSPMTHTMSQYINSVHKSQVMPNPKDIASLEKSMSRADELGSVELGSSLALTDIDDNMTDPGLSPVEELAEQTGEGPVFESPSMAASLGKSFEGMTKFREQPEAEVCSPVQVYAILDSNAVLKMLTADRQSSNSPFGFLSALTTPPGKAQVKYVLLHTVNRELDGLKKDPRFRLLLSDFLRDARTRPGSVVSPLDGLRARCIQHGVLVELSEEEAEMEVTYGGHYRSCDLQGPDAMILNVSWYLYTQLQETYGDSAHSSVVLITNDMNMHHWAGQWKLPCVTCDDITEMYRHEPVQDLSSARTFLKCAGIKETTHSDNATSLKEVFSHAQIRSSRSYVDFLESALPKLEAMVRLEALLAGEQRAAVPTEEIRALLKSGAKHVHDGPRPPVDPEIATTATAKKVLDTGYALLDQILAGVARTESMTSMELGHSQTAGAYAHHRTPSHVKFN